MKLISWNTNGIRAALKKGAESYFMEERPDIVCLQETKCCAETQPPLLTEAYPHQFWNFARKKGYSGTAILSRSAPIQVIHGMGIPEHDGEGRLVTAEFTGCYVVTVYTPNSQNELARLDYRVRAWDTAFRDFIRELDRDKPVIFCGDLNVAHQEIDLRNPKTNTKNAGFTPEERASFTATLRAGFADTFRTLHPDQPDHYSWWSYRANARAKNVGWRIDYVCCSERILPQLTHAFIRPEIPGSDHCPVGAAFNSLPL